MIVAVHLVLFPLCTWLAFLLRFDGNIPDTEFSLMLMTLPLLMVIRTLVFIPFKLFQGLWRYTDIWDIKNIAGGVFVSSSFFAATVHLVFGWTLYPRSVFVVDSLLLIMITASLRLGRRAYKLLGHLDRDKRVLIFGAGDAGAMLVRDMLNNPFYECTPVGFIDDDPHKWTNRIHGVPVLGGRDKLPAVLKEYRPHELVVAVHNIEPSTLRSILKSLEPLDLPLKIIPNLRDVLSGKIAVNQVRNLAIEDLLTRKPIGLDSLSVKELVRDKCVMITGAGGSIGSELARQVALLGPRNLVLYERYENSMYSVLNELEDKAYSFVRPVVGDVADANRLRSTMEQFKPQVIFHAAAHKHVPLMELNPTEAVKNNVTGTRTIAEIAHEMGVQRFILISTDKAVNPSSIMGATKRIAELLMLAQKRRTGTIFTTVRFGNVLGSNGSVVPRFLAQIHAGGPVTVTHPEIRRYFMLIPEAVQLVLHAAAMGEPGALYVLDMGEQIPIVEMARNLIRLSGFVPDRDIPITFVGLRPGEKLFEELARPEELLKPSVIDKIFQVQSQEQHDWQVVENQIQKLEDLATAGNTAEMLALLRKMMPTLSEFGGETHFADAKEIGKAAN